MEHSLFVGYSLQKETIQECLFLRSKGILSENECTIDALYWFLPLFQFLTRALENIIPHAIQNVVKLTPYSYIPVGLLFHAITYYLLKRSSLLINNCQTGISYLYLLMPFYLFSWTMSPVPSVLHLIIVAANYSALKGWTFCMSVLIAILISGHFNFIFTVPAYFCLLRNASTMKYSRASLAQGSIIDEEKIDEKSNYRFRIFAVALLIVFLILLQTYNRNNGINQNQLLTNASTVYRVLTRQNGSYNQPASGIFWYLDVQAFEQFSQYFKTLITYQPVLFFVPLLIRLSFLRPLHTVNITTAIVLFFRRETSLSDIVFLIALFLVQHADTIFINKKKREDSIDPSKSPQNSKSKMRFVPFISLGIVTPMIISPLMMRLWTTNGSGNANFLFFQGFMLWIFFALAVVEFTNETVREIDDI